MDKFKVGDKVRLLVDGSYSPCCKGDMGIISAKKHTEGWLMIDIIHEGHTYERGLMENDERWELEASHKPRKPTHLVVWEEDTDPCRFFNSESEANEFVKELSEKSSVRKDSIVIVEIKSARKVTIQKSLRKSEYKI